MSKYLILILFFFLPDSYAYPAIDIVGLFDGKAVITIDGKPTLIKVGDVLPNNIKLIKATAKIATFEINGEIVNLGLNTIIGTKFHKKKEAGARIFQNQSGVYISSGLINQKPVQFLVDTGASTISLSSTEAKKLGINYDLHNRTVTVSTAMGMTIGYGVTLDSVRIGEIELNQVDALVLDGDFPEIVLLGMSFLNRVEVLREDKAMLLKKKY